MSTTAGVGSQEYVAINNMAVTCMVLGLVGLLSLVATGFLAVAGVGLVCGLIAVYQIRNSNGTQGGKLLVAVGVVLALGMLCFVGWRQWAAEQLVKQHRTAISSLISDLGQQVKTGNYLKAYGFFHEEFRRQVPLDLFEKGWQRLEGWRLGPLEKLEAGSIIRINPIGDGRVQQAITQIHLTFRDSQKPIPISTGLEKQGDGPWQIVNIDIMGPN
jgi:hypothetical protein